MKGTILMIWGPFCPLDQPHDEYIHVVYPSPGERPWDEYNEYRYALESAMEFL